MAPRPITQASSAGPSPRPRAAGPPPSPHPARVTHSARVAGSPHTAGVTHAAVTLHEARPGRAAGAARGAGMAGAAFDAHRRQNSGAPHAPPPAFVRVDRAPDSLHGVKLPPHLGEHGGGTGGVAVVLVHRERARGPSQFLLQPVYPAVALGQPGVRVGPQRLDIPVPAGQRPGHYVAGRPRPGQLAAQQRRLSLARHAPGRRVRLAAGRGVLPPEFGRHALQDGPQ